MVFAIICSACLRDFAGSHIEPAMHVFSAAIGIEEGQAVKLLEVHLDLSGPRILYDPVSLVGGDDTDYGPAILAMRYPLDRLTVETDKRVAGLVDPTAARAQFERLCDQSLVGFIWNRFAALLAPQAPIGRHGDVIMSA